MPRTTPPGRLPALAAAACRVFAHKGYRRALLTDVAAELGLSHALLYRWVDSKHALFELALMHAIDPGQLDEIEVPLPTPPPGRVLDLAKAWAADQCQFPALEQALTRDRAQDPAAELAAIIDECYAFVERNRPVLALIQGSAKDIPEFGAFWFGDLRRAYFAQLADYLHRRTAAGQLRQIPHAGAAARFITESIAWFAWRRNGDPGPDTITDEQARQTVRQLLLAALT